MKNKALLVMLLITAAVSSVAVVLKFSFSEIFGELVCFPFEQIGMGLRWLSLQGGLQNGLSIVLYAILCLSPLVAFCVLKKKKAAHAEDYFLVALSMLFFYVNYMMINPALIPSVPEMGVRIAKALVCGTAYAMIVTYLVLRVVRLFFASETKKLHRYMVILLSFTALLFVISIFGIALNATIAQMQALQATNIGTESGLWFTYLFLWIQLAIDSIPSAVSILVVFSGIAFLNALSVDPYSTETINASEKLSNMCKTGLIITVCSSTTFNLLQLIFMNRLRNINSLIQLPLFSVLFVLCVLIVNRMVMANKILKEDNDSII